MTVTENDRRQAKQTRFNPLRGLTPQMLATALDSFETGWLRQAALIWETIERRAPIVSNAVGKRKRAVSRRPWEIIKLDDSPEAEVQQEAAKYLFDNIEAKDALRGDVRGGMSLLIKQAMNAPFYRSAVHELAWRPSLKGITVACHYVPLWFFEETTGRLRYTGPNYTSTGQELKPGEWMVTCGDGIMEAISVAYMFAKMSLEDWVSFSERFGTPGVLGKTKAAKGSDEGNAMADAVAAFGTDFEGVIYGHDGAEKPIELIESARTGDAPFEPMVERMERTIVALCRGSDLGTLSSANANGASLQEDESSILEEDDCELISETFNTQLLLPALRWRFGPDVEPKVKIQITPSATPDVAQERSTDEFLIKNGVKLSAADLAERYGRTQADEGEQITALGAGDIRPEDEQAANDLAREMVRAFRHGFQNA